MRIKGIKKRYKVGGGTVAALDGVSFDLPKKGMVFILGKSGCGKSTLLNVMSGLDKADEGSIEVDGKDITRLAESEISKYRNSCCGFIFQEYNLISELNVSENIKLSLELQGKKDTAEKVKEVLKQVGLEGYENRKVTELSGGQKQRIAIARAIIKDPKIIFADEPTGALDEKTGESILNLLKEFSSERLVIVVTHDREFAEKFGDRIIELADGKVVSDSKSRETSEEEKESNWKKPKLPIKVALKIGCSNFKYHPIRLIATVLLSVIAFTLLGASMNIAINNEVDVYVKAIYDNKVEYTALHKYKTYPSNNSLEMFLGGSKFSQKQTEITRADMDLFRDVYDGPAVFIYELRQRGEIDISSFRKSIAASREQLNAVKPTSDKHFAISSNGYISISLEYCEELGFNIVGELPKNSNEIAITECMLNSFMLKGLIEDGVTYPINRAEDVIGHKISISIIIGKDNYKTITGVVDTGCNKQCFITHLADLAENYHDKIFVSEDYFSSYSYVICTIDSNHKAFAKAVMNYDKDNTIFRFSDVISDDYYIATYSVPIFKTLFLYLSIVLLLCAMILFTNFIAVSIRSQMKQIGILSSIGADFKQLIKIYSGSALGIGGIIYLLALPLTAIMALLSNKLISPPEIFYNLISFNPPIILFLFVFIFAAAILSSIAPLIKIRKITPINMIGKGQIK